MSARRLFMSTLYCFRSSSTAASTSDDLLNRTFMTLSIVSMPLLKRQP